MIQFRWTAFLILLSPLLVLAGVGGKLAGTVSDVDGNPLAGANVVVRGTPSGTATDLSGQYYVLNLPPGTYDIQFSMIGYRTLVKEDVQIVADFTTRLDAALETTTLEAGTEVVVTADRPLIRLDATSTLRVVDAEALVAMPVKDFKDVLVTQAGFTRDAAGGIHVRGGRTKEVLYMIDGVVVKDPLQGDFNGSVNQDAIQEMTVISGTFNAEYGQAMSSVVNIVTKEGGRDFNGKLEFTSDQLNESPYHQSGAFADRDPDYVSVDTAYHYVDLGEALLSYYQSAAKDLYPTALVPLINFPLKGRTSLTLSGPLPLPNATFFAAGLFDRGDSPLPHGADINQDLQLKITQRPVPTLKLVGHLHSSYRLYQAYDHTWKYRPEFNTHTARSNDRLALSVTHSPREALYYTLNLARQVVQTRVGVQDLAPEDYRQPLTDASVYFYNTGNAGSFGDNVSTSLSSGFNLTWQANSRHQFKSGITFDSHTLDIHTEEEPWEAGTNFVDDTTLTPREASFYVQDKIEFDYLIVNLGLRYDWLDPNMAMWSDVNRFVEWDSLAQAWQPAAVSAVPASGKWSPRLGLALPVTANTVFHFSYGHFFQTPNFEALTYNSARDISASLPLVGNARIKPQKTVAFEVGLKQALGDRMRLETTVWSKDIRDLLSTLQVRYLSNQVIVYANTDYASVKGLDLSIDRQLDRGFSANASYTYSVAKGNNSSPTAGYFSAYENEEVPHQEYFLSFDQRHDFAFNLFLRTREGQGPGLGGIHPFSNLNLNLLLNAGSGLPYTPYVDPTVRVEVNSARKPWTYTLDLRLRKSLVLNDRRASVFLEVTNLTDHENVLYVNSRTGKPFDTGTTGLVGSSDDSNLNPARLGPGRAVKLGMSVEW